MSLLNFNFAMIYTNYKNLALLKNHYVKYNILISNTLLISIIAFYFLKKSINDE